MRMALIFLTFWCILLYSRCATLLPNTTEKGVRGATLSYLIVATEEDVRENAMLDEHPRRTSSMNLL